MAQRLEPRFTAIPNAAVEALARLHLTPNQWQVLMYICRKTRGYQKKVDRIANSQIIEGTNLGKSVVSRVLSSLHAMNIITRNGKVIGLQEDTERWKCKELLISSTLASKLAEPSTFKSLQNNQPELAVSSTEVSSTANEKLAAHVSHKRKKENFTKETIQKKEYGEFNNVLLSDEEMIKLINRFGKDKTNALIESLSIGIKSKGYKYNDHYATILNWERRDSMINGKEDTGTMGRRPGKVPTQDELNAQRRRFFGHGS